jgi:hypothetical protein
VAADPIAALQEVLDGAVQDLRYAQGKVDQLTGPELWRDTLTGKIPNEWIRLRNELRVEVERCANNMVRNGIAERAVAIGEARMVLVIGAIREAALEVGFDDDQIQTLGLALKKQLEAVSRGEGAG